MPEYKMADIDPNDYKPMGYFDSKWPISYCSPKDINRYLVSNLNLTKAQIDKAIYDLEHWEPKESTFWQKIGGYIYFGVIDLIETNLTPERLSKILSHLDQLIPYMPTPWLKKLIGVLDTLAEKWADTFK